MSHLVAYEEAKTEKERALRALDVVEVKNSKRLAWNWAERAAEHAEACGVGNAQSLLGNGRWPEISSLKRVLNENEISS